MQESLRDELEEVCGLFEGSGSRRPARFQVNGYKSELNEDFRAVYVKPLDKVTVFGPGLEDEKSTGFYIGSMVAYMHQLDASLPGWVADSRDPGFREEVEKVEEGFRRYRELDPGAGREPLTREDVLKGFAAWEAGDAGLEEWGGSGFEELLEAAGIEDIEQEVPDSLTDRVDQQSTGMPEGSRSAGFRYFAGSVAAGLTSHGDVKRVGDEISGMCHGREQEREYLDFMNSYLDRVEDGYTREEAVGEIAGEHLEEIRDDWSP